MCLLHVNVRRIPEFLCFYLCVDPQLVNHTEFEALLQPSLLPCSLSSFALIHQNDASAHQTTLKFSMQLSFAVVFNYPQKLFLGVHV